MSLTIASVSKAASPPAGNHMKQIIGGRHLLHYATELDLLFKRRARAARYSADSPGNATFTILPSYVDDEPHRSQLVPGTQREHRVRVSGES
jgi:hypothetical protein